MEYVKNLTSFSLVFRSYTSKQLKEEAKYLHIKQLKEAIKYIKHFRSTKHSARGWHYPLLSAYNVLTYSDFTPNTKDKSVEVISYAVPHILKMQLGRVFRNIT